MRRYVAIALVAGCGRFHFDEECRWSSFSAPQRLPGPVQSTVDDWGPTPTLDETEVIFGSYRGGTGGSDIFRSMRPSPDTDFETPVLMSDVSSPTVDEGQPTLTADGLVIMFASTRGTTDSNLYEATRSNAATTFGAAVLLDSVSSPIPDDCPWISADGLYLVFATGTLTQTTLHETTRSTRTQPFAPPRTLTDLDSPGHDTSATLSDDLRVIFFVSNRPGGIGLLDVYTAQRVAVGEPFSTPQLVPELSSPRDEWGVRLSRDGTTMYFNFDALITGGADADLWIATRSCD